MRLPNGYGGVIKLSGARRRPCAARITTGWYYNDQTGKRVQRYQILGYAATRAEALQILARPEIHESTSGFNPITVRITENKSISASALEETVTTFGFVDDHLIATAGAPFTLSCFVSFIARSAEFVDICTRIVLIVSLHICWSLMLTITVVFPTLYGVIVSTFLSRSASTPTREFDELQDKTTVSQSSVYRLCHDLL